MPTGACASILPLGKASAIKFKVARFRTTTKRQGSFAHADGAAIAARKRSPTNSSDTGASWYLRILRRPKMKESLPSQGVFMDLPRCRVSRLPPGVCLSRRTAEEAPGEIREEVVLTDVACARPGQAHAVVRAGHAIRQLNRALLGRGVAVVARYAFVAIAARADPAVPDPRHALALAVIAVGRTH